MSLESLSPPFVRLKSFSGPLDLLLDLVRKQEMDIFQIDIHKIAGQYAKYVKRAAQPDLEGGGDFIRMASLLMYIKSKSLLPKKELEEEEPSAEELKRRLSGLLARFQKFQKAGEIMSQLSLLGRDCWKSPRSLSLKPAGEAKIEIDKEEGLLELMRARAMGLARQKAKKNYRIAPSIPSFLSWLRQIAGVFSAGGRLDLDQISRARKGRYSRLLSFLSILELSKAGFVRIFQKKLFSNIEIFVKKPITGESLRQIAQEKETERLSGEQAFQRN